MGLRLNVCCVPDFYLRGCLKFFSITTLEIEYLCVFITISIHVIYKLSVCLRLQVSSHLQRIISPSARRLAFSASSYLLQRVVLPCLQRAILLSVCRLTLGTVRLSPSVRYLFRRVIAFSALSPSVRYLAFSISSCHQACRFAFSA